jgi:putative glutamine amidotransferase
MRPVIGISGYHEQARWGVWDMPATLVPHRYTTHVHTAGGLPVVLPPLTAADPDVLGRLDGVLLAGGADLNPATYGAEPDPATTDWRDDRDAGEFALARAALAADVPLLGICRGLEVLVAATGGSLLQHLPDVLGEDVHRGGSGVFAEHSVRLQPGSQIHSILGDEVTGCPSYHHQGVASVAGGLTAVGWADDDVIEAVEMPGRRFAIGVLWHPEASTDERLFEAFVGACR